MAGTSLTKASAYRILAAILLAFSGTSGIAVGETSAPQPERLARLNQTAVAPLALSGGSSLMVVSPSRWQNIASDLSQVLRETHRDLTEMFGEIPSFSATVRILDEEAFFALTNAPRWTNALYYRGEISLPVSPKATRLDLEELSRSVRHEYSHAAIHALSGGRCPGWLDEGLAQWLEGGRQDALDLILKEWVRSRDVIPLAKLQKGFTRLDEEMVPPAYAQSLFAVRMLISRFGLPALRTYFEALRTKRDGEEAFRLAFNIPESKFEESLRAALLRRR